jgi:HPt (histidine-containing phosphotransfer) domain-containing protein
MNEDIGAPDLGNPSVPPGPTLSRKRLDSIERDVSREFLLELVGLFVSDVQKRLERLAEAVKGRETRKVLDVAHALQGAAASLGVLRLRHMAARLEEHVRRADWTSSDRTFQRIVNEFAHVRGVLSALHERVTQRPPK